MEVFSRRSREQIRWAFRKQINSFWNFRIVSIQSQRLFIINILVFMKRSLPFVVSQRDRFFKIFNPLGIQILLFLRLIKIISFNIDIFFKLIRINILKTRLLILLLQIFTRLFFISFVEIFFEILQKFQFTKFRVILLDPIINHRFILNSYIIMIL